MNNIAHLNKILNEKSMAEPKVDYDSDVDTSNIVFLKGQIVETRLGAQIDKYEIVSASDEYLCVKSGNQEESTIAVTSDYLGLENTYSKCKQVYI